MNSFVAIKWGMRLKMALLSLAAFLFLLALTVVAHAWRTHAANRALTSVPPSSSAPPKAVGQPQLPLEVEVVTVNPTGFWPKQIVRPVGPYILLIENRSGLSLLNLQMTLAAGQGLPPTTVFQIQLPKGQ